MRIALGLEYDGSSWGGWQFQGHDPNTIQHALECALSKVADHPVSVVAAGRTDAGVHASGMVVHFDTHVVRSERSWVLGANRYLPDSVAVQWATLVQDEFHARFRALARRYRYLIYNHPYRSALMSQRSTWHYHELNVPAMHAALRYLAGEHDFSSLRAAGCQARQPVRCIQHISLIARPPWILLDIQANGFLHHMVRNIIGVLLPVGEGKQQPGWVGEVLAARDRTVAGVTAPPYGLYFVDVLYPEDFVLPRWPIGPAWWQAD